MDLYVYISAHVFLGDTDESSCFIFQHVYFQGRLTDLYVTVHVFSWGDLGIFMFIFQYLYFRGH